MSLPEMQVVCSSNVAELGYDQEQRIVYVRFHNGTLYTYADVPEFEYEALFNAPSIGSYLNRNFKGVYVYQRIE